MKIKLLLRVLCFLALGAASLHASETIVPDLKAIPSGKVWKGAIEKVRIIQKEGAPAVEMSSTGVIWLDRFEFADGTIEFDGKGKSGPPQSNFMGVIFRVVDENIHDVVYFRPFNFRAANADNRSHALQYASHPDFGWDRLRKEHPGQYECALDPAPHGDEWFHAKVVIAKPKVSVFVNGATQPSLVVNEITARTGGSVGLYFFNYGIIANLKITRGP